MTLYGVYSRLAALVSQIERVEIHVAQCVKEKCPVKTIFPMDN